MLKVSSLRKLCLVLLLFLLILPIPVASQITVDFIDVGQGDAILIHSDEIAILIDGGTKNMGRTKVVPHIQSLDIRRLDMVVMTHPHADHIGGLIPVLEQIPVNSIYADGQVHTSKTYEELLMLIEKLEIPFLLAREGMKLEVPEPYSLTVLHPSDPFLSGLNNNSVVLFLEAEGFKFLFTGDIEKEAESQILSLEQGLKVDVLKVAHHGSNTSSTEDFIKGVNPRIAVIMAGKNNVYDHPHSETLHRLSAKGTDIYCTSNHGMVRMFVDDGEMTILTYRVIRPTYE